MVLGRFALLIFAVCLVVVAFIYLLHRFCSRIIKYVVPVLALIAALANLALTRTVQNGFGDIVALIYAMIFGAAAASGLVACLILDYVLPRMKRKS